MADCHHKNCCGCERPVELVAEVAGGDGVSRFDLCEPHYYLIMEEAMRKGIVVMVSPFDDEV